MGTVQKVLLYGGTFDPPHNGHMNNLRAALELVRPDKAIVMPAGIPPHKKASTTPGKVRLAMCQCFTALSPAVEVSDWEIAQGGRSYTVHTLEMLRDAYPGAELYLCVGSDMLLTFTQCNDQRVDTGRLGDGAAQDHVGTQGVGHFGLASHAFQRFANGVALTKCGADSADTHAETCTDRAGGFDDCCFHRSFLLL